MENFLDIQYPRIVVNRKQVIFLIFRELKPKIEFLKKF